MIQLLLHHGVRQIVASEICEERRAGLLDSVNGHPVEIRATRAGDEEILAEPCDVLSPCALGGVLGPKTIPSIRAKIICGPANNQLVDEQRDALALKECGIAYVPDFLANRMGIVACSNEQYGGSERRPDDPAPPRSLVEGRHLPDRVEGARPRAAARRDPRYPRRSEWPTSSRDSPTPSGATARGRSSNPWSPTAGRITSPGRGRGSPGPRGGRTRCCGCRGERPRAPPASRRAPWRSPGPRAGRLHFP